MNGDEPARTAPGASGPPSALREAVWSVDPDVPVSELQAMEKVLSASVGDRRFTALLLTGFGALALVLGAVGVWGVTACAVARPWRRRWPRPG